MWRTVLAVVLLMVIAATANAYPHTIGRPHIHFDYGFGGGASGLSFGFVKVFGGVKCGNTESLKTQLHLMQAYKPQKTPHTISHQHLGVLPVLPPLTDGSGTPPASQHLIPRKCGAPSYEWCCWWW
ncbi:uncharacterized protein LOC123509610 [Portunus trituberculatus]|uniref:uncharacterized protein LOC123509610 n=1 Tax=Portunus trituberculatus TaxID=210409 RepID=UPI001E1CEEBF|nr:uncharacterized protein LOC123509610 [Portunus trituberculatus]